MKKTLFLMIILLLCGCAVRQQLPDETEPTDEELVELIDVPDPADNITEPINLTEPPTDDSTDMNGSELTIPEQPDEPAIEYESRFSQNWKTMTADDDGWVGIDPMIALDPDNNPHIAYYDQANRDLKYAYFDGDWHVETVDSEGDCGEEPGIDIDSEGNPHIAYQDHTERALAYATKKQGKWHLTKVDSVKESIDAMSISLKVDSRNNVHIAYSFAAEGNDVYTRYAYFDGDWHIEKISSMGCDMIIDLDSNDIPHISSKKDDNRKDRISYTTKRSGKWVIETVDSTVEATGDTGIAVDKEGSPHIVYNTKNEKKYATLLNGKWITKTIVQNAGENEGVKIAVDKNGIPHVVYNIEIDDEHEYLIHAYLSGNDWVKEEIYTMGNPAIAIDSLGKIHVAHNSVKDEDPKKYVPDYDGDEKEIEILKYSVRNV